MNTFCWENKTVSFPVQEEGWVGRWNTLPFTMTTTTGYSTFLENLRSSDTTGRNLTRLGIVGKGSPGFSDLTPETAFVVKTVLIQEALNLGFGHQEGWEGKILAPRPQTGGQDFIPPGWNVSTSINICTEPWRASTLFKYAFSRKFF